MSNGIWGRLEWQGLFRTSFSVVSKTTEDKEQQSTRTTTKEGEEERENLFSLRNHHQKLEEDNKNLSLDPQRNHQYHHQLHHHHQTHPHQQENEEEEDREEEEEEQQEEEEDLTHQHPHLHLHQQEQGFHGFYQLHQPTSLNQHQNPNLIYGRIPVSVSEEPLLLNTQNPQKKRSYFPSSSSSSPTFKNEYARLGDQKMEETQQPSSRLGVVRGGRGGGGGEIIEVQGGHIIRSTGRKDRHSKVCTAKGPRDRRVRLSAHTAIQFYDVQDRLGYDRPSKAVDWLIKKAKASIDELAELPPWRPTASTVKSSEQQRDEENNQMGIEENASQFVFQHQEQNNNNNTNFLPPSLDSDSIADTIKSFFPMAAAQSGSVSSSSSIHFQNYQTPPDLLSRTSSQTQDLRLSLQSFQDPMLLHHNQHHHHHHHHPQHHSNPSSSEQALFSTAFDVGGGSANWSDQQMPEMGRFQRILAWNPNTDSSGVGGGGGGFIFNSPPPPQQPPSLPVFSGQNPLFSQRGPLQSSNSPSIRAWNIDPSMITPTDHYQNLNTIHHHHHQSSSISGTGFTTSGFSGFRIPARIQGEEEEHDAAATSNNQQQSSASRQ